MFAPLLCYGNYFDRPLPYFCPVSTLGGYMNPSSASVYKASLLSYGSLNLCFNRKTTCIIGPLEACSLRFCATETTSISLCTNLSSLHARVLHESVVS